MIRRFNRERTKSFSRFIWQRFVDDKCFETAGALSYTTLVSLVPLTVAVFAVFSAFPVFQPARDTLITFVFNNVVPSVPSAGYTLQKTIEGFAKNASSLTGVSILVMLFSALSMMISIEDRLNRIWRVHQPRSWGSRLLLYWAALTLGPILVVGGIAVTSYVTAAPLLRGAAGQFGGIGQSLLTVLPFVVTFFTLWLMYSVIPNCKVSRRDAAIGALLGAVLFEIARWGFTVFVQHAQTYQQIYGVLAAIPIFLLWIYLSWVIVILAASIAASASAFEYHAPMQTLPEGAEFLGLLVVLRYFVEAQRTGGCVDPADVRLKEPYLRSALIAAYFDDLREADMIQRGEAGGWLLCRSLDCTNLLRVYRHIDYPLPLQPVQEAAALGIELPPELLTLLAELAAVLEAKLGVRLDQIYPVADNPAADTEELPA
jgi:membrane protein